MKELIMNFFETHPVKIVVGVIILLAIIKLGNITTSKDEGQMAVAEIASKDGWSSFQEISVMRQISIDTTLHRIELGIGIVIVLLGIVAFKLTV